MLYLSQTYIYIWKNANSLPIIFQGNNVQKFYYKHETVINKNNRLITIKHNILKILKGKVPTWVRSSEELSTNFTFYESQYIGRNHGNRTIPATII